MAAPADGHSNDCRMPALVLGGLGEEFALPFYSMLCRADLLCIAKLGLVCF